MCFKFGKTFCYNKDGPSVIRIFNNILCCDRDGPSVPDNDKDPHCGRIPGSLLHLAVQKPKETLHIRGCGQTQDRF